MTRFGNKSDIALGDFGVGFGDSLPVNTHSHKYTPL
jgi:hypothetical protein